MAGRGQAKIAEKVKKIKAEREAKAAKPETKLSSDQFGKLSARIGQLQEELDGTQDELANLIVWAQTMGYVVPVVEPPVEEESEIPEEPVEPPMA